MKTNANTTNKPTQVSLFAKFLALSLGLAMAGLGIQTAHAQKYWLGGTVGFEQDWGTASNWSPSGVPTAANYSFITNTLILTNPVVSSGTFTNGDLWHGAFNSNPSRLDITGGSLSIVGYLAVAPDAGSVATVNHSSGTVAVSGGGVFFVGQNGSTGTYNLSGDAILTSTKTLNVAYNSTSTGNFNMSGGTLTVNNSVNIGGRGDAGDGTPTATFTMSGGTFSSTSWFSIGESGSAAGTLNLSGGTVNAATAGGTAVNLGDRDSASGTLNVSGGTFNSTGGGINVGNHWTGSGANTGTLTITNTGVVNTGPSSVNGIKLASSAAATGTVNLDGGMLLTHRIQNGSGSGTFNFNGGTLKATANNATFMQGLTAAYVLAGGAIIDSTNFSVTIAQSLSGGGGLTKIGNGALTLSGANGYTGPTVLREGTLTLDATPSPTYGSVTVSNGAALGLALNNGASTVTAGSVTFNGNTALNFNYGTAASPTTAMNASSVSVTGTNTINIAGQNLVVGQYVLISTGSSVPTNNFKLGTLPTGIVAVLTNSGTSLDLLITASGQNLAWYGADSVGNALTNWNINTSSNWNSGTAKYLQYAGNSYGDNVVFDDNLYLQQGTNVNLAARVVPTTLTVNSTLPYSITGTGGIDGVVSLLVTNTGSLYLGTSNGYTGGTIVGGATLIITNNNALGTNTGSVTLAGGTLQINGSTVGSRVITVDANSTIGVGLGATAQLNGAVNLNANATIGVGTEAAVQLTGPVSGAGGLTKVGNGTLILASNYTAALIQVNAGTGVVAGAVSPATSDVRVGDGSGTSGSLVINSGGTLTMNNWLIAGRDGGNGTINVNGGTINQMAGFIDVGSFGAGVAGTLNLNSGTITTPGEVWIGEDGTATGNQSGGAFTNGSYFVIARNNGSVGTYNLSGGTVTAATSTTGSFAVLGSFAGSQGTLNVSGGSFTVAADRRLYIGEGGTGTLNVSGTGLVTSSNIAAGGIRLGVNGGGVGTVNLNGGTIQAALVSKGSGSGTFNFNGGTLRATTNSATFMQGLTAANVRTNGAIIDTSSNSITIGQALLNNGVDPDGGLTKNGNGTLLLNGVNTYTNVTTINAGTLGGTGSIAGPVTMGASSTLAPGASIGTLTISNNLTFAGGMVVEVDNTNAQTSDLCVVTGTATKSGGGTIIVTNLGPALVVGNAFQLFNTNVVGAGSMTVTGGGAGVTWTNNLAVDGTIMVLTTGAVAPSPTLLTNSVVGGTNLALSWPAGQGWRLQSQVTNRAVGLNTNWVYITDTSVTSTNIAIDKTNGAVFYRLVYP